MAVSTMSDDLGIVAKLGDNPNTDNNLSEDELKATFDKGPKLIQNYLNTVLVPALNRLIGAVGFTGTHSELSGRDEEAQHPISAILGLTEALNSKASNGHNHSGIYAEVNHNHDDAYAAAGHDHEGAYLEVTEGAVAMPLILVENVHYGATVPENPEVGRLYFIPVSEAVNL